MVDVCFECVTVVVWVDLLPYLALLNFFTRNHFRFNDNSRMLNTNGLNALTDGGRWQLLDSDVFVENGPFQREFWTLFSSFLKKIFFLIFIGFICELKSIPKFSQNSFCFLIFCYAIKAEIGEYKSNENSPRTKINWIWRIIRKSMK